MSLKQSGSVLADAEYQNVDDHDYDDDTANATYDVCQYDLVSSPNDFNTKTMVKFIESDVFRIPDFQRSYVWDLKRASRLVESIIVGLPVPQIFLYEKKANEFLVIDGQQRLLSLYFFVKGRFPKPNMRTWATMPNGNSVNVGSMPLMDDEYFVDFRLELSEIHLEKSNPLHGRSYEELDDEAKKTFDIRTIRNVIIRQMNPAGYDSIYEIFSRLNSGGVKLAPQEIRRSMYESKFYSMLYQANNKQEWRSMYGRRVPDIRMKDVEVLLRGFAMLISGDSYSPSLLKFLNRFSNDAKSYDDKRVRMLERLLDSFLDKNRDLPADIFHISGRFSPMIFESAFVAACTGRIEQADARSIDPDRLKRLRDNEEFKNTTRSKTTGKDNVNTRLKLARSILVNEDER